MNDILLGIVLFVIYFCFVSCAISERNDAVAPIQETPQPIEQAVREMLDDIYDEMNSEDELEFAPIDLFDGEIPPASEQEEEKKQETPKPAAKGKQASQAINIAKLNLRHARVACSVLGIKQKVNDRDVSLVWMQSQINARLKEQPEKEAEIYKAIANKFSVPVPSCDRSMERLAC
jgi:hypothetical protein